MTDIVPSFALASRADAPDAFACGVTMNERKGYLHASHHGCGVCKQVA
jgi:hypothetical protein